MTDVIPIERLVPHCPPVRLGELLSEFSHRFAGVPYPSLPERLPSLDEVKRAYVELVLKHTATLQEAARTLGVNEATLYRWRRGAE